MNQKTFGILPEQFTDIDIEYSTTDAKISDTLEEKKANSFPESNPKKTSTKTDYLQKDFQFTKIIILGEKSYFCMGWNVVDILCCIISCYVYGWMALFGSFEADGKKNYVCIYGDVVFFVIFTITIFVNFITDYRP